MGCAWNFLNNEEKKQFRNAIFATLTISEFENEPNFIKETDRIIVYDHKAFASGTCLLCQTEFRNKKLIHKHFPSCLLKYNQLNALNNNQTYEAVVLLIQNGLNKRDKFVLVVSRIENSFEEILEQLAPLWFMCCKEHDISYQNEFEDHSRTPLSELKQEMFDFVFDPTGNPNFFRVTILYRLNLFKEKIGVIGASDSISIISKNIPEIRLCGCGKEAVCYCNCHLTERMAKKRRKEVSEEIFGFYCKKCFSDHNSVCKETLETVSLNEKKTETIVNSPRFNICSWK